VDEHFNIDLFLVPLMSWSIARRLWEHVYFALRHYCFHILAFMNCFWLPFIRQAENELKPHKSQLHPQHPWTERLGRGRVCPLLIFIFPLVLTLSLAFLLTFLTDTPFIRIVQLSQPADSFPVLAGYLATMAGVLAAVTGLLLTVIALTIGVKTSNLAGASFLLNGVIRRRAFLPVAAFLVGTVLTSLLGAIFSNCFPLTALVNYTSITAILSLLSIFILFDLLRRTMQTLGSSELEDLLTDELLSSLRQSFRRTLRQALVERHFSETLADLGFARSSATHKQEGHPTEYRLKTIGKIVAIDPAPLKRISRLLKLTSLPPDCNTSSPFLSRPDDDAPWVTIQRNGNVSKATQLALLTNQPTPDKRISKLIQNAFIIQKPSGSQPPWQRLREVISSAIEKYESTTITIVATALTDTFEDYLETQAAVAGQDKLVLEAFTGDMVYDFKPPHPYKLRLSDLTLYAARSHSQDCLDELLTCIYRLARKSFEKLNEKYFRDWIFEFYWAYHSFRPDVEASHFTIAPDITRRLHWLSNLIATEIYGHEKSVERVRKISPYALSYMSLCLRMLRTSAERCHQPTFDSVLEHIREFLKHQLKDAKWTLDLHRSRDGSPAPAQSDAQDNGEELALAYGKLYDHKNLVYVVAGAWLMHNVRANKLRPEKISPFVDKLADNAGDLRSLLDLYAMPGMQDMPTSHDNALGFDNWDWPNSLYSKTRCGTDFQRWINPFYQFLLLKKATGATIDLQNIRQTQIATHESLIRFLREIGAPSYCLRPEYQDFPFALDTGQLQTAKDHINELLTSWSAQPEN